jgi:hypothetical protein
MERHESEARNFPRESPMQKVFQGKVPRHRAKEVSLGKHWSITTKNVCREGSTLKSKGMVPWESSRSKRQGMFLGTSSALFSLSRCFFQGFNKEQAIRRCAASIPRGKGAIERRLTPDFCGLPAAVWHKKKGI